MGASTRSASLAMTVRFFSLCHCGSFVFDFLFSKVRLGAGRVDIASRPTVCEFMPSVLLVPREVEGRLSERSLSRCNEKWDCWPGEKQILRLTPPFDSLRLLRINSFYNSTFAAAGSY